VAHGAHHAGYVKAVAVSPAHQREGLGTQDAGLMVWGYGGDRTLALSCEDRPGEAW